MFWLASVGPVTSSEPGETLSPSNFDSQICWHVFFCWLAQKIWRFGRGYTDIWSSPVNFISQTFYRSELDDHYRPWARLSTLYWQSDHNYRRYILMRLSVVYFCIKLSWPQMVTSGYTFYMCDQIANTWCWDVLTAWSSSSDLKKVCEIK